MRKISTWARHHRWTTRLIIFFIYIALNIIGIFLANALYTSDVIIPSELIYIIGFAFLVGVMLYPSRQQKSRFKNFYRRQKLNDLVLATTSFLLVICFSNHSLVTKPSFNSPFQSAYALATTTTSIEPKTPVSEVKPLTKKERKTIKKKLLENIKKLRKEYKDSTKGEKAALIILSVLIALGLLYLLAAISCSIACNGSEGLAYTVALLGSGLIIFLLVKVIHRISRGKPKAKEKQTAG